MTLSILCFDFVALLYLGDGSVSHYTHSRQFSGFYCQADAGKLRVDR